MKFILWIVSGLMLSSNTWAEQNESYACLQDGKTLYTTVKINEQCQLLSTGALAANYASESASVPQIIDHELTKVWDKNEYGMFNDVVIIPPIPTISVQSDKPKVNDKVMSVNLRKQPTIKTVTRQDLVRLVSLPPKPAMLTRRQILQQEIDREQAALRNAKTQLALAQKSNNATAIARFSAQVKDRQLNLDALQEEMRR